MKARKVAYIVALLAVELLAPSNAEAGGVSDYRDPSGIQTVTISQQEYRKLIQDQMMLQLYETGEKAQGSAVTLSEANQIVEEALGRADALQMENERLTTLLKEAQEKIEEEPVVPEVSFLHPRLAVGGGVVSSADGPIGLYVDGEYRFSQKLGAGAMLLWVDGPVVATGVRYHLR